MSNESAQMRLVHVGTVPFMAFGVIGVVVFCVDCLISLVVLTLGAGTEIISHLTHVSTFLGLYHSGSLWSILIWAPLKGFSAGLLIALSVRLIAGLGWLRFSIELRDNNEQAQSHQTIQ